MKKLNLYGTVGWDFTASDVKYALNQLNGEDVEVEINSPGGAAYEGIAIFNVLKQYSGKVTTVINGLAASAASLFFLAGDERKTLEGSFYMIHNSANFFYGTYRKADMQKAINQLTKFDLTAANFYSKYTTIDNPSQKMDDETFFTTDEMLESGIVTEVVDGFITNQLGGDENMLSSIKDTFLKTNADLLNVKEAKEPEQTPEPKAAVNPEEGKESIMDDLKEQLTAFTNAMAAFQDTNQTITDQLSNFREEMAEVKEQMAELKNMKDELASETENFKSEKEEALKAREEAVKEKEDQLSNMFPKGKEAGQKEEWGGF